MNEQEDPDSKTLIAAPGLARRLAGAPKSRLIPGDPPVSNEAGGVEILLDRSEITIGRAKENHIVLEAKGVSRRHARVFPNDDCWYIEDSGSTNGIKVNGETTNRVMLNNGDTVEIGPVLYTFSADARPLETSEKTTFEFAPGIPGFDPNRQPGNAESSIGSDALLWSIVVIGASAVVFAVFTVISV